MRVAEPIPRILFIIFKPKYQSICNVQGDHSPGKVREFQSGQGKVLNTPKPIFRPDPTGGAYDAPEDLLVGWGGGHPIPFPQLLQPQQLNN